MIWQKKFMRIQDLNWTGKTNKKKYIKMMEKILRVFKKESENKNDRMSMSNARIDKVLDKIMIRNKIWKKTSKLKTNLNSEKKKKIKRKARKMKNLCRKLVIKRKNNI